MEPPEGAPGVSVVVPTFRGGAVLARCLESLRRQDLSGFECIVVDDGSGDGTAARVREAFQEVRVVALAANQGFCRAVNHGIRAARGRYVALLNDDTVADPSWLRGLIETMEGDPEIGFCASRMLRYDAPEILDGAGDGYSRHGLSFRVGRGEPDRGQYGPRDVLWASGGACAYRRRVLDELGLLDETFEAYYEDVDLGLRARSAGWRGRYVPESAVRHVGSWSDRGDRSTFLTTRNSLLVVAKHWPGRLILRTLPWLVYGHARNGAWAVRHGRGGAWARGVLAAAGMWRSARSAAGRDASGWRRELARDYPFGVHGTAGRPTLAATA
jgi:GT2 family glycosyltransferase